MLDWIDNHVPGPWRKGLEPPLLAVVTFITTLALADICYPAVVGWLRGDGAYLGWIDIYWLLEPGLLTTWSIALAVALVTGLAVASGWSGRRIVRTAGGLLSFASLMAVVFLIAKRPEVAGWLPSEGTRSNPAALPWPALLGLIAGGFGGLWIAIGQGLTVRQSKLRRLAVVLATGAAAVVLGAATLADVIDEYRHQTFRPFKARLVAVYRVDHGTSAPKGAQTITHDKQTYIVLKSPPALLFTDKDVRRIRRRTYRDYRGNRRGLTIRFASRLHERIARRTGLLARNRYFEALFLDGTLWLVAPVHSAIYGGRVLITDDPSDPHPITGRLYRALTR